MRFIFTCNKDGALNILPYDQDIPFILLFPPAYLLSSLLPSLFPTTVLQNNQLNNKENLLLLIGFYS